jgi:hypothetical protein
MAIAIMGFVLVLITGCVPGTTNSGPDYSILAERKPNVAATYDMSVYGSWSAKEFEIVRTDVDKLIRVESNAGNPPSQFWVDRNESHLAVCRSDDPGFRNISVNDNLLTVHGYDCSLQPRRQSDYWNSIQLPDLQNVEYVRENSSEPPCHLYRGDLPENSHYLQTAGSRFDLMSGKAEICLRENGVPTYIKYTAVTTQGEEERVAIQKLNLKNVSYDPPQTSAKPPITFSLTGKWLNFSTRDKSYFEVLPLRNGDFDVWIGSGEKPSYSQRVELDAFERTVVTVPSRSDALRPSLCIEGECQIGYLHLDNQVTCLGLDGEACRATNRCVMDRYCQRR